MCVYICCSIHNTNIMQSPVECFQKAAYIRKHIDTYTCIACSQSRGNYKPWHSNNSSVMEWVESSWKPKAYIHTHIHMYIHQTLIFMLTQLTSSTEIHTFEQITKHHLKGYPHRSIPIIHVIYYSNKYCVHMHVHRTLHINLNQSCYTHNT
jgi:hypothetical protein